MAGSRVPAFFVGARNRFVNGAVPGNVFDARGNYMGNGGRAAIATGVKVLANMIAPGTGWIADRALSGWVNRGADYGIGKPVMEQISIPGAPSTARAASAPSPSQAVTQNLGLGAQRPGGNWYGYTGGPGSMGSFGNTQFGNGMASIGQWNPQSIWGQQVAAPAGSNLDLGNNVGGFIGGGGSGSGGSMGGSNAGYGSVASNLGLTRGGGAAGGWQTASNWGQLLGRFSGDPEMYTQAI
ncbi:TPA: hypothetical protein ACOEQH_000812 [Stenotrophomonas maltophilia]